MIDTYDKKQLKLNAPLRGLAAGHVVKIKVKDGVPIDRYWRRRLKDALIDGCVEIVAPKRKISAPKTKKTEKSEG